MRGLESNRENQLYRLCWRLLRTCREPGVTLKGGGSTELINRLSCVKMCYRVSFPVSIGVWCRLDTLVDTREVCVEAILRELK